MMVLPVHVNLPWVFNVAVFLGDQCTISVGCEVVAVGEKRAIDIGRGRLRRQFPEFELVIAGGPAQATRLRLASDAEYLACERDCEGHCHE
jgi:hypothetical protein